ncbi:MAG: DUF3383 family protein [Pseudomonadota bacterium]
MSISNEVASVTITLGTRAPVAANFGIAAVFCKAPFLGGRLYELSSEGLKEMVTDGFTVNDRGYLLASSMNSQSPHTDQVLVYNRAALTTSVLDLTPLITTIGTKYEFELTYKNVTSTISHTVSVATVNAICDALEILIDASLAGIAGAAVAPDNATATKLTFTGSTPGEPVLISGANPALIKLLDVSTDAGIATDLANAALDHSFYGFVIDSFAETENNAAAAWSEANSKLFFAHSADSTNVVDAAGTGVAQDFFAASYNRAVVCNNFDMPGNLAACVVSRQLALDPGTSAAAFKSLSGVAADALRSGQISNAKGKNVLIYALDDGTSHTWFGKAASGRSLRIQQALDLLDARIREAVLGTFLSNEFIPMSDRGFALMAAAVRGVLSAFLADGIIEPEFTVTVPKAATISDADKIAGKLSNLRFACVMPTDMLKVEVSGNVSF